MNSSLLNTLATALMALVFGFLGAAVWSYSGLADNRTRTFLLDNPDMLPQMAQAYQEQEASKRLADLGDEVYTPFPGAVLGNPEGSQVLVEFTDYNCPYCEASLADVERLVADNPDLKVIIREWPIFEGSDQAARMALAAGMQGKYLAFHKAMFANGPSTPENIEIAAQQAGLDLEKAQADAASDAVTVELARNLTFAQSLGFGGTPAWVTSSKAVEGAIGYDGLKAALEGSDSGTTANSSS
ncbi:MAG: DsbA family protein [Pseudomonadota bacterium]